MESEDIPRSAAITAFGGVFLIKKMQLFDGLNLVT
jgi:hypothetical protein